MPITLLTTSNEATLVAGPAISKTSAAPGVNPFNIKAAAIGIDPVAHRYIGIEKANTIIILRIGINARQFQAGSCAKTPIFMMQR